LGRARRAGGFEIALSDVVCRGAFRLGGRAAFYGGEVGVVDVACA